MAENFRGWGLRGIYGMEGGEIVRVLCVCVENARVCVCSFCCCCCCVVCLRDNVLGSSYRVTVWGLLDRHIFYINNY